jgi:hypothetical protein
MPCKARCPLLELGRKKSVDFKRHAGPQNLPDCPPRSGGGFRSAYLAAWAFRSRGAGLPVGFRGAIVGVSPHCFRDPAAACPGENGLIFNILSVVADTATTNDCPPRKLKRQKRQVDQPLKKVCPSIAGGNNYWPSSYSPRTKLLYIPAMTACMTVAVDREKHTKERGWNGGSYTTDERIESNLTAVDPTTGEIKKNVHLRYPNYSGTLATSGGLVFLALLDGTVAAFDDTTLDEMWKINVGSGFSAPPMTFETGGKQYIAIVSGPSPSAKSRRVNTPELNEQRNALVLYVFGL